MSKFQVILTAIFVICIIAGVAMFATYKGDSARDALPSITIWGTFPKSSFDEFVQQLNLTRTAAISVSYVEIKESNFRTKFIEELARGRGPDAILIPQQQIMGFYDKIIEIPNNILTQRDFKNTYVSQTDLYLTSTGALAIPLVIDPLVMYWNRSTFTNAGIAKYPQYWDEFADIVKKINQKDENSNIRKSAIAMGEFQNINHAREILSTLFLQAGNPITFFSTNGLESTLGDGNYSGTKSSIPALAFFTQFSDPRNPQYSWNRSLPSSKSSFLAGNLATYFGFASEISDLRNKNPNLNFDIAPLPQARKGANRAVFGNMYGFSIVRSTASESDTYEVIKILTATDAMSILNKITYLPSVRRDVIASGSVDPYMSIFLDSSLISNGWLDTNPITSYNIFTDLVESITSGRADPYSAVRQASDELNLSLENQ